MVTVGAIQAHGGFGFTQKAEARWLRKHAKLDAALASAAATGPPWHVTAPLLPPAQSEC
jgi:hypothetical protein